MRKPTDPSSLFFSAVEPGEECAAPAVEIIGDYRLPRG
jgi:hypothetical protein